MLCGSNSARSLLSTSTGNAGNQRCHAGCVCVLLCADDAHSNLNSFCVVYVSVRHQNHETDFNVSSLSRVRKIAYKQEQASCRATPPTQQTHHRYPQGSAKGAKRNGGSSTGTPHFPSIARIKNTAKGT